MLPFTPLPSWFPEAGPSKKSGTLEPLIGLTVLHETNQDQKSNMHMRSRTRWEQAAEVGEEGREAFVLETG